MVAIIFTGCVNPTGPRLFSEPPAASKPVVQLTKEPRVAAEAEARSPTETVAKEQQAREKPSGMEAGAVPEGVAAEFYDELAPHGDWLRTDAYGDVWRPSNVNHAVWRPYTDGTWAVGDEGWTWVSNEPFGGTCYHYGRWVLLDDCGWVWVPGTEWAPAWVAWRADDYHAGWAPLPPEFTSHTVGGGSGSWGASVFSPGPACYNFVPIDRVCAANCASILVDIDSNEELFDATKDYTRFHRGRNNRVCASGPNERHFVAKKVEIKKLTPKQRALCDRKKRASRKPAKKKKRATGHGARPMIIAKVDRGWSDREKKKSRSSSGVDVRSKKERDRLESQERDEEARKRRGEQAKADEIRRRREAAERQRKLQASKSVREDRERSSARVVRAEGEREKKEVREREDARRRERESARDEVARRNASRSEDKRRERAEEAEGERRREARREDVRSKEESRRRERDREEEKRRRAAEETRREKARGDEARREKARRDEARREEARREASREKAKREEARRQEASREEARREEARREEARRQEARREEARRQEARREEARREEARREEARREEARRQEASRRRSEEQSRSRSSSSSSSGGRSRRR